MSPIAVTGPPWKCPFGDGVLPELSKCFGKDFIKEINEVIIGPTTAKYAEEKMEMPTENGNLGMVILNAICSSSNIRFPHDFSL